MWGKKLRKRSPIRGMDGMAPISSYPLSEVSSFDCSVIHRETNYKECYFTSFKLLWHKCYSTLTEMKENPISYSHLNFITHRSNRMVVNSTNSYFSKEEGTIKSSLIKSNMFRECHPYNKHNLRSGLCSMSSCACASLIIRLTSSLINFMPLFLTAFTTSIWLSANFVGIHFEIWHFNRHYLR